MMMSPGLVLFATFLVYANAAPRTCKEAIQEKYKGAVCSAFDSVDACEEFCDHLRQEKCNGTKAFVDIMHCNNAAGAALHLTCCCE